MVINESAMSYYKYFVLIFLLLQFEPSFSQNQKLYEWESYLPFHSAQWLAQNDEYVFVATPYSLVKLGIQDNSVTYINKEDGLSNVGISNIIFSKDYNYLVISYLDSNVDILKSNGDVININAIVNNPNIIGDRHINNVKIDGKYAFFSCNFGLVQLDLEKLEFGFTCFTNGNVTDFEIFDNHYYIATSNGVFRVVIGDNTNYQNFQNWERLDEDNGFPSNYSSKLLGILNNKLLVNDRATLYSFDGNDVLTLSYYLEDYTPSFYSYENDTPILGITCNNDCDGKVLTYNAALNEWTPVPSNCYNRPLYAIAGVDHRIWFADQKSPMRKLNNIADIECEQFEFNSPTSTSVFDILIKDNDIWTAPSGFGILNGGSANLEGANFYHDGRWQLLDRYSQPILTNYDAHLDFNAVAAHPTNGKIYIASYFGGLIEWDNNTVKVFNELNSSLLPALGDPNTCRVCSFTFDNDNNLWISNTIGAESAQNVRPISVYKNDGTWQNFVLPTSVNQEGYVFHVAVDNSNNKWFTVGGDRTGILVFNENGTWEDTSDDSYKFITSSNSVLPSNITYAVAVDLEGDVWVGTADGVVVFECGGNVFKDECKGNKRIVEVDDIPEYLLGGENVRCIAVDDANRKWFGTTNGVFIASPDGTKILTNYKKENSSLLDNTVNAINFDHKKGIAYIGTANGLCSIRTDATQGSVVHNKSEFLIFPNPVSPDYTGPIAIKGLSRDANVKITDISGRLVFETTALGGQAIWDGKDYLGRKVSTGVYLVFSSSVISINSPDGLIGKIIFIK
ncbi:MAG: hypothetical protein KA010_04465 [Saprospiraceae bacterium]|nr:hypothetical protein [Saprospiraceae bacterium]